MEVVVDENKCTGCQHCKDVCPVSVYEMQSRTPSIDPSAEEVAKWSKVSDGHRHFAKDNDGTSGGMSKAVNGPACILCQACLIECEGECITIKDDSGNTYRSVYK